MTPKEIKQITRTFANTLATSLTSVPTAASLRTDLAAARAELALVREELAEVTEDRNRLRDINVALQASLDSAHKILETFQKTLRGFELEQLHALKPVQTPEVKKEPAKEYYELNEIPKSTLSEGNAGRLWKRGTFTTRRHVHRWLHMKKAMDGLGYRTVRAIFPDGSKHYAKPEDCHWRVKFTAEGFKNPILVPFYRREK